MTSCPSENSLLQFVDGDLSAEEAEDVLAHIDACPDCRALLIEVARPPAGTSQTLPGAPGAEPRSEPWTPPDQIEEYHLLRPLGNGAMGQVYIARDARLDRDVAIKFIAAPEPDAAARDRFLLEARAVARLAHPNVVGVHRAGEVDGRPYLVSEYIVGRSLDRLELPLPWERVLQIGLGLSRGLSAAHERGVLHRDIKPANAILAGDGEVKLLDFGLAKLLDAAALDRSAPSAGPRAGLRLAVALAASASVEGMDRSGPPARTAAIVGTPRYMAPEIWRGEPASRQADVYSLGALLYELCAGRAPHEGGSREEMYQNVQGAEAQSLGAVAPGADARLATIVDRCLRRDPRARYRSGQELCQALQTLAQDLQKARWTAHPAAAPSLRRVRSYLVAAMAVALLAGGAAWRYWRTVSGRVRVEQGHPGRSVLIPKATFLMGSTADEIEASYLWCRSQSQAPEADCKPDAFQREQPLRRVTVAPFFTDETEVTNEQFAAWLNGQTGLIVEAGRWVRSGGILLTDLYPTIEHWYGLIHREGRFEALPGFGRRPVTQVTWNAAQRYCEGRRKRLPTEAEWERMARGQESRRFPWGYEAPRCEGVAIARYKGAECAHISSGPAEVGTSSQDRTPEGVYDLAGNVAEWVLDRFEKRYPACQGPCIDPRAEEAPGGPERVQRVVRGGAWDLLPAVSRSAARSRWWQDEGVTNIGFRCTSPAPPR